MDPHRPHWNRQARNKLTAALKELQQDYEAEGSPDAVEAIDAAILLISEELTASPGRPSTREPIACAVCGVPLTPRRIDQVRTKNYCRQHHPRNEALSPRDQEMMALWNSFPECTYQDLADNYGVSRQRIEQRLSRMRSLGYDLPNHYKSTRRDLEVGERRERDE